MSRKYNRYTKGFKLEVVRLLEEADKQVTEVTRKFWIQVNQIYKYIELESKSVDALPGKGRLSGHAAVAKLR